MNVKVILSLLLIFIVVIFTLQNTHVTSISFMFWHFSLSRALLIFIVFGMGVLIGLLLASLAVRKPETSREKE